MGRGGKAKKSNSCRRFVISCLIERRERENLGLEIEGGRGKRETTLWPPKAAGKNEQWSSLQNGQVNMNMVIEIRSSATVLERFGVSNENYRSNSNNFRLIGN